MENAKMEKRAKRADVTHLTTINSQGHKINLLGGKRAHELTLFNFESVFYFSFYPSRINSQVFFVCPEFN